MSLLTATCHCGAVRIEVSRRPATLTSCNCSICRRYGTLWAYYRASAVRIHAAKRKTRRYSWGDRQIRFVRCGTCGCVTHWQPVRLLRDSRIGINARNFDPAELGTVRIRYLDGASTWKVLARKTLRP